MDAPRAAMKATEKTTHERSAVGMSRQVTMHSMEKEARDMSEMIGGTMEIAEKKDDIVEKTLLHVVIGALPISLPRSRPALLPEDLVTTTKIPVVPTSAQP